MYSKFREAGETFEQFAAQLKILVNDCSNGRPGDMVRDRIIIGVHNSKIRGGGDYSIWVRLEIRKCNANCCALG